jgi:hypothetical protein
VQLSGFVDSKKQRDEAVRVTETVPGVTDLAWDSVHPSVGVLLRLTTAS